MKDRGHYAGICYPDDNRNSMSAPLEINCVGYLGRAYPFLYSYMREDYYLQLFDRGCLMDGGGTEMVSGQFIVRPPRVRYQYQFQGDELGYYWAHFTGFHVGRFLKENGIETGKIYTLEHGITDTVREGFEEIFREFMLRQRGWQDAAAARLMGILVTLIRDTVDTKTSTVRFEESMAYIHSHYSEEISTGRLAEMEHLSESRYREVFRMAFGCSPKEYVIGLRMANACELLGTTDMSITQIAQTSGYEDAMYFSRIFHRKNGQSPAEYRKQVRASMNMKLKKAENQEE